MSKAITTSTGTTITIAEAHGERVIHLDSPGAPEDMRPLEAGRVVDGGFQPAIFSAFAMTPEVLRGIADVLETQEDA